MTETIPGVLITGTIGAGKSTIASVVSEVLHERGDRHALLEADWLGELYPAPDTADRFNFGLVLRNLALIWPNFVEAGARKLILTATLESRDGLEGMRGALPGVDLKVVRLIAAPHVIEERLRARERGHLLDRFLERTALLEAQFARLGLEDLTVENGGRPAWEVAEEIVDLLRWR